MDLLLTALLITGTFVMAVMSWFMYRAQVDPHVVVYSASDPERPQIIMLVIHNIGRGVAFNVTFKLDQPIPDRQSYGNLPPAGDMLTGPLMFGIRALGPNDKREITWGDYRGLVRKLGDGAVRVTATFESRGVHPWNPQTHEVESFLEVISFENNDASRTLLGQVVNHLEHIAGDTKTLAHAAKILTEPEAVAAEAQNKEIQSAIVREVLARFIEDGKPQPETDMGDGQRAT